MNDLMLHLRGYYHWFRCRKCRRNEHDWEKLDPPRLGIHETCKRPSCTAVR